jgi:hypothetical protein
MASRLLLNCLVALGFSLFIILVPFPIVHAADQLVSDCSSDAELRTKLAAMQSDGGTLSFNCGVATIVLTGGVLPTITGNMTIDGGGTITLSGNEASRILVIDSVGQLGLNNITLTKAFAIGDGGAVHNSGMLNIAYSKFLDNHTTSSFSGGAILTYGELNIFSSEFAFNSGGNGGAVYPRFSQAVTKITASSFHDNVTTNTTSGWGGAMLLWDGAPVTVETSTFSSNIARNGGAIYVFQNSSLIFNNSKADFNLATELNGGAIDNHGTATLNNATISFNSSANVGGGIANDATLTITNSTFNHNATSGSGGAIYHSYTSGLTVSNTTLSRNSAAFGGAISTVKASGSIINSTLFGNFASYAGSGINTGGRAGQEFLVKNTVIAESIWGENCYDSQPTPSLKSSGFNLSDDTTCTGFFVQASDKNNLDAMLGPLANNGGPTQTHLPQAGSPLIDEGTATGAPATDQRGIPRPQGAVFDIGAVETCAKLSKPGLLKPGGSATVKGPPVNLDWSDVVCANNYQVLLKLDSKDGVRVQKTGRLTASSFSTGNVVKGQTYAWQVTAFGIGGLSAQSAWRKFTVK